MFRKFEKVCMKIQRINLIIQLFNKYLFSVYYVQSTFLDQWSSTGGMLPPRVQLTISGDLFDRFDLRWDEEITGIQ